LKAYLLIISTQAPYNSSASTDAFEAALAATNVGLEVKVLFQHDGVYQMISTQSPEHIQHKNMFKKLKSLPLFDIEEIYIDNESIEVRELRITNNELDWQSICKSDMISLIGSAQQVLVF
jgi:tRNA 2-thiouridine synthesizing protein C